MRAIEAPARIASLAVLLAFPFGCRSQPERLPTADASESDVAAKLGATAVAPAVPAATVAEQREALHDKIWGADRAHRPPTHNDGRSFVARPWAEIADPLTPVQIRGGGARKAPDGSYPATLVLSNGRRTCTSTAVGPRVILTAAHCVKEQPPNSPMGYIGIVQIGDDPPRELQCERHGDYATDLTADFALCLADSDLGLDLYENVDDSIGALAVGTIVKLQGFGCIDDPDGNPTINAYLYEGSATIEAMPPPPYYTTTEGDFLCDGDSGGGAFTSDGLTLFGVNSRVEGTGESKLSTTGAGGFPNWATGWAERHGVAICGLDDEVGNCRSVM